MMYCIKEVSTAWLCKTFQAEAECFAWEGLTPAEVLWDIAEWAAMLNLGHVSAIDEPPEEAPPCADCNEPARWSVNDGAHNFYACSIHHAVALTERAGKESHNDSNSVRGSA